MLRDYQREDVDFMVARRRVLNANEPGLGKTLETISATQALSGTPALVLAPKMALGVWEYELRHWTGQVGIIYDGTPTERRRLWRSFQEDKLPYLITNYAKMEELFRLRPHWETIICDEIHMPNTGLFNHKTATYARLKKFKSRNMFLLTGTPVNHGPADLFAPFSLLEPEEFKSYWGFVNRHCIVLDGPFGKSIEGRPKSPVEFKKMWSERMIYRRKKDHLHELPEKIRKVVPLEMTPRQAKLYNDIADDMMGDIDGGDLLITPTKLAKITRLRQILVTPQLVGLTERGAALEMLPELIQGDIANKTASVIFTPFAEAIPFIQQAIAKVAKNVHTVRGGSAGDTVQRTVQAFQELSTHNKVLICSIKTGASFTAHSASIARFLGYSWSANENIQAEDRIHRMGQTKGTVMEYMLHRGTVDQEVMDVLNEKQIVANITLTPEMLKWRV